MLVLIELSPLDSVGGSRVTLRAASADDRTITGLNGVRWWPGITDTPTLSIQLFEGDFSTDVSTGTAAFTVLTDKLARLDPNAKRYRWAGAPVTIYAGNSGDAWPWTTEFQGKVDTFSAKGNRLQLTAKVDEEPFQKNVLTATYAGTGGIEGGTDLANKVKPWLFGHAMNVEPVMIDSVNNVLQFSAYGPIQAINNLYERASDFGASVGDFASYTALVAATIPAGRWGTCLAFGLVRLGAPPFGVITGDVDGDKPSTWLRKTGEILTRIATNAGVSSGLLDSASLSALDTAVPYTINLFLNEQVTVIELAKKLVRPCNAQAAISWLGKLFVTRLAIGTPALTLDAQGRQKPGVTASTENDVSPPYWRVEYGAARSWRVHTLDEIAFIATLTNRGTYSSSGFYRTGDIVQDQGSSWVYVNSTPGTGNAPPTLPTTSNSFWQSMADPGSSIIVTPDAANFRTTDNAFNPSTQTINFTAALYNLTGTISWVAKNPAGSTVKSGTGTSFSLAQSDMGTNLSLVVTATCGWASSQPLTIGVVDDSTAAAGATADMTLTPFGTGTVSGNTVTSHSAVDGNDGATTAEKFLGACEIIATINSLGTGLHMIDSGGNDWAAAAGGDGNLRAVLNGSVLAVATTVAVTDAVAIVNDETKVVIWKNGVKVYTFATAPTRQLTWYAKLVCGPFVTVSKASWRAGSDVNWNSFGGTGLPETSADVTRILTVSPGLSVAYDYTGTTTTQLPVTLHNKMVKSGVDVTSSTTWSYTASGCTVTTTAMATGDVSLTAVSATNASILVSATIDGVPRTDIIAITRTLGQAPAGGGGGGTFPSSYSEDASASITATSYTTVNVLAASAQIQSNSSGQIRAVLNGSYNVYGSGKSASVNAKLQKSTDNSTWSDAGLSATGTTADGGTGSFGSETDGSIAANSLVSGFTASTNYYLRWVAIAAMTGVSSVGVSGTASGAQS